jgi:prepilin-type N-terminal cleavage/methylation domain-containing protein
MSRCIRSTPRCGADNAGFSLLELLVAIAVTTAAMAAATGFFHARLRFMRNQEREIETTHAARASIDVLVRDLRLGGACLPVNGDFITLEGANASTLDEITTRTGLTRPDLSCVRTTTGAVTPAAGGTIAVERAEGFIPNMRAYIRAADGPSGEYFNVTSVNTATNTLGRDRSFTRDYPQGSGIYAIDERRYFISDRTTPWGIVPQLRLQIGDASPTSFAVGIQALDVRYRLRRNCPPCDVVELPADTAEWRLVDEILLTLTARSVRPNATGTYYRRTMNVAVKPRNLLPNS